MGNKKNKKTKIQEDIDSHVENVTTSFECDYCSFETMDVNVLTKHVANCCSSDQPTVLGSTGLNEDSKFICPVCLDSCILILSLRLLLFEIQICFRFFFFRFAIKHLNTKQDSRNIDKDMNRLVDSYVLSVTNAFLPKLNVHYIKILFIRWVLITIQMCSCQISEIALYFVNVVCFQCIIIFSGLQVHDLQREIWVRKIVFWSH